jgi:hypothetical protein
MVCVYIRLLLSSPDHFLSSFLLFVSVVAVFQGKIQAVQVTVQNPKSIFNDQPSKNQCLF